MGIVGRHVDHIAKPDLLPALAQQYLPPPAQHDDRVLVRVLFVARVAAGLDLEVAQLERRSLPRIADEKMAIDAVPGRCRGNFFIGSGLDTLPVEIPKADDFAALSSFASFRRLRLVRWGWLPLTHIALTSTPRPPG